MLLQLPRQLNLPPAIRCCKGRRSGFDIRVIFSRDSPPPSRSRPQRNDHASRLPFPCALQHADLRYAPVRGEAKVAYGLPFNASGIGLSNRALSPGREECHAGTKDGSTSASGRTARKIRFDASRRIRPRGDGTLQRGKARQPCEIPEAGHRHWLVQGPPIRREGEARAREGVLGQEAHGVEEVHLFPEPCRKDVPAERTVRRTETLAPLPRLSRATSGPRRDPASLRERPTSFGSARRLPGRWRGACGGRGLVRADASDSGRAT